MGYKYLSIEILGTKLEYINPIRMILDRKLKYNL